MADDVEEAADYLIDDVWAELPQVSVPTKLKITRLIHEYGDARVEAVNRDQERGIV